LFGVANSPTALKALLLQASASERTKEAPASPFMFDIRANTSDDAKASSGWNDVEVIPKSAVWNGEKNLKVPMLNPVIINSSIYENFKVNPLHILSGTPTSTRGPAWWDGKADMKKWKRMEEDGFPGTVKKADKDGPATAEGGWLPPIGGAWLPPAPAPVNDPYELNAFRPQPLDWASKLPARVPISQETVTTLQNVVPVQTFDYKASSLPSPSTEE